MSEPLPASLGLGVASLVMDGVLLSCKSSCILLICIDVGAFRFVCVDIWPGSVYGKDFLIFLTSLASGGAMCRVVSIVVVSC